MPLINPALPSDGDDITEDSNNIPLIAILALINGNLDTDNISSLSGSKISSGTIPSSALASSTLSTWSSTYSGFSVSPTSTNHYISFGKICHATVYTTVAGTSNSTSFTMTLPVAASTTVKTQMIIPVTDNGTQTFGLLATRLNSNVADITPLSGGWTNSGNKFTNFTLAYETV